MLHKKLFMYNFNHFTINENVLSSVGQSTRRMRAEIIWFGFLQDEILSLRRYYPEVLKLMFNKSIGAKTEFLC